MTLNGIAGYLSAESLFTFSSPNWKYKISKVKVIYPIVGREDPLGRTEV